MPRQPIQVLVIPFRKHGSQYQYCLLKRSDAGYWQFVAGGADGTESPIEAARREAYEEAGVPQTAMIVALESVCSVPANIFRGWRQWPPGTYVVKEFAFGIECSSDDVKLSDEHTECQWLPYEEALTHLKWDSNKTALWELSQRLAN